MEKQKKKQNGITLIALVISIIVMLILAGVSLNMTVGDNGIIKQAQHATYAQSIAVLEEFLQQTYVENYDDLQEYENKLDMMTTLSKTKKYFQKSSNNEYYFLSLDTYKEYYFIEKDALPNDIKNSLAGGETSLTGKTIYADFNDIYGITSDLKVFYCQSGYESWLGAEDNATVTDLNKTVFKSGDAWGSTLGITGDVTLSDLRSLKEVTVSDSNVDLSKLGNFGNLTILRINGTYADLNGIENAPMLDTVYINYRAVVTDYSALGKVAKLNSLYFVDSNDAEVAKFCNTCSDAEFKNLKYLCISSEDYRYYFGANSNDNTNRNEYITTVEPLANLSSSFKKSLEYLCISCNSISSLYPLRDYTGLYLLNAQSNNLTNLNGINENMSNLTILRLRNNYLGKDLETSTAMNKDTDSLSYLATVSGTSSANYTYTPKLASLYWLDLARNDYLIWIDYLKAYSGEGSPFSVLFFDNCTNLSVSSLTSMKSFLKSISCSLNNKYDLIMLDSNTTKINLASQTIQKDVFLGLSAYTNVVDFNCKNLVIYDGETQVTGTSINTVFNTLLKQMPQIKFLDLFGQSALDDFSFLSTLTNLIYLDARNTGASTSNSTKDLQLLNNITTFRGLGINSSSIDLTKLQPTLARLGTETYSTSFTNRTTIFIVLF